MVKGGLRMDRGWGTWLRERGGGVLVQVNYYTREGGQAVQG